MIGRCWYNDHRSWKCYRFPSLFSIQMTTCKGGVGCTLQDHWHQMNIHVQLNSIKFIVSVNIYLLICPWGSILKVKPCNVGGSILDFQPPWKTNIKGTMQPILLSNGSVVSDKNNFKIYFPQGNTQVKFVLQWLPSWISKQHKNWKHCKRPSKAKKKKYVCLRSPDLP